MIPKLNTKQYQLW